MLKQQLPAMLQYIAGVLHHYSSKVLIAGCNELETDAAVVAIAYSAQQTGHGVFHALVELQHCYNALQVCITLLSCVCSYGYSAACMTYL